MKVVLSGSGTLYPVHVGALKALVELSGPPDALCGASGGAIVAAAAASGYLPGDGGLEKLVLGTLPGPSKLIDWSWMPWARYGLIKGDLLLEKFREIFPATFKETLIPLTIVTTDLRGKTHKHYSTQGTPDADLPLAVRKSMSLPFVFKHIDFEIDGGVLDNFPLDIYGTGEDVVGFRILHSSGPPPLASVKDYIQAIIGAMMESSAREHMEDAVFARTIRLKVEGSGTNFEMDEAAGRDLIQSGYVQALDQLGVLHRS